MFLESSISTSNLSKSIRMHLRQYWRNRLPVLKKSKNQYWRNRLLLLAKSYNRIDEIIYWYRRVCLLEILEFGNAYIQIMYILMAEIMKSFTSSNQIVNWYRLNQIIFFPRGKNIIYFRDVNVFKIWSKRLDVRGKNKYKNLSFKI